MWLYFFSALAIGSVRSLNIDYPYRILFDSAPFQSKVATPQGFLIYIDNSGTERIVSFNYAEPVYAIRRIIFINSEANDHQKFESVEPEYNKDREAHFRAWSLQQYQVLKREIDFLRGEGKEPSNEMILKFLPLEKIALTSDFSKIAGLPEVKRVQEEHLNIWKHAIHTDEEQTKTNIKLSNFKLKSSITELKDQEMKKVHNHQGDKGETSAILSSFEGKTAKDELKLSSESGSSNKVDNETKSVSKNIPVSEEPIETTNKSSSTWQTRKEVNESLKQQFRTAEEAIEQLSLKINANTSEDTKEQESIENSTAKNENFETCAKSGKNQTCLSDEDGKERPLHIHGTDEVREEHLNLVIKANKQKVLSEVEKLIFGAPGVYVPQQVVDTDEVKRAREEHLKIVNETIFKAKLAQSLKRKSESSTTNGSNSRSYITN